ncbi:MAG: cell filamentation protein Fic [Deltaproteobacteria bacterium RIFCSPLOWO2_02_FULL_53_8]|nr:MAG: cell filamentation protein Fic [Deltaproteobacteria bacterium RIFCSPLOWO2_02_FULL_53_8]
MESVFKHYDLELVSPDFSSSLTDLIIELDYLRRKKFFGSTPQAVFFQLKHIFHTLESIGSARIEGNNTTIAEYIETKLAESPSSNPNISEILNIEQAMSFIDENVKDAAFNRIFISELHKKVVEGLLPPPNGEGDQTPGVYRSKSVSIARSAHLPPEPIQIERYMEELFAFINKKDVAKYDLLKVAIAHHRFLWIHPYTNGNGRTVRLFTYAMLVKQGFNVNQGRILNPTAVFCSNRKNYYRYLSLADTGKNKGILSWCEYVLKGVKDEIEKIDRLLDYDYLKHEILLPAISYSQERKFVTDVEARIIKKAIEKKLIQAADLKDIFHGKSPSEISRNIGRLINKKMLMPAAEGTRKYVIRFDNSFLLRGIIHQLGDKDFLPIKNDV